MSAWGDRAAALGRRAPNGARVAEIGHGVGKMARVLASERPDIRLMIVDNWLPADAQPERYRRTRDNFAKASLAEAEARYRAALELCVGREWQVVRSDSVAAAECFGDEGFDLVFIDADHSEEGVSRDIAAWKPKIRPGGWIGGHDYGNDDPRFRFSGVKRAVDNAFGDRVETDLNFTWWVRLP